MHSWRSATMLALLLSLCSCHIITHDYDGARELTPGTVLTKPSEGIGKVQGSKKATFLIFGLIPLNDGSGAQLAEDLATEWHGGGFDGITEIRIAEETDALDVIVSLLTVGIFSMRTVEVEGLARKFTAGGGS